MRFGSPRCYETKETEYTIIKRTRSLKMRLSAKSPHSSLTHLFSSVTSKINIYTFYQINLVHQIKLHDLIKFYVERTSIRQYLYNLQHVSYSWTPDVLKSHFAENASLSTRELSLYHMTTPRRTFIDKNHTTEWNFLFMAWDIR